MDITETNIKMCEKARELQELMNQNRGHLLPPDDGIYHRTDPYPAAVIYDHRPTCPICNNHVATKFCPTDGGEVKPFLDREICFGGPSHDSFEKDRITWLFYQHQLQEMVIGDFTSPRKLAWEFGNAVHDVWDADKLSMEQLWLTFVMNVKYGKVWDKEGEDWV